MSFFWVVYGALKVPKQNVAQWGPDLAPRPENQKDARWCRVPTGTNSNGAMRSKVWPRTTLGATLEFWVPLGPFGTFCWGDGGTTGCLLGTFGRAPPWWRPQGDCGDSGGRGVQAPKYQSPAFGSFWEHTSRSRQSRRSR